jgi:hypothetical protein
MMEPGGVFCVKLELKLGYENMMTKVVAVSWQRFQLFQTEEVFPRRVAKAPLGVKFQQNSSRAADTINEPRMKTEVRLCAEASYTLAGGIVSAPLAASCPCHATSCIRKRKQICRNRYDVAHSRATCRV